MNAVANAVDNTDDCVVPAAIGSAYHVLLMLLARCAICHITSAINKHFSDKRTCSCHSVNMEQPAVSL